MGGCQVSTSSKDGKTVFTYQLNITTRTATKSYNFLFDVNDPSTIVKQNFKISQPGLLMRNENEVTFIKKQNNEKTIPPGGETVLDLKLKNNHLTINKPVVPKTQDGVDIEFEKQMYEMPWILAKQSGAKKDWLGLKLRRGDVVRFGRIKFRIKAKNPVLEPDGGAENPNETQSDESSIEENHQNSSIVDSHPEHEQLNDPRRRSTNLSPNKLRNPSPSNPDMQTQSKNLHSDPNIGTIQEKEVKPEPQEEKENNEEPIEHASIVEQGPENLNFDDAHEESKYLDNQNKACRICLWDDEDEGDPIIQPCKCSGTMKNVHINCFKQWISKKVDKKETSSMISVFWKRLQCEICHTEVSHILEWKGTQYSLVDVPTAEPPNIVLEYFHNERVLGFHVIKYKSAECKKVFGRGTQCQIRVHDSTVSRVHGQISYVNRQFFLSDLGSKYGTYILLDETRNLIKSNSNFSLQVGRTIVDCHVRKIKNFIANGTTPKKVFPLPSKAEKKSDSNPRTFIPQNKRLVPIEEEAANHEERKEES